MLWMPYSLLPITQDEEATLSISPSGKPSAHPSMPPPPREGGSSRHPTAQPSSQEASENKGTSKIGVWHSLSSPSSKICSGSVRKPERGV